MPESSWRQQHSPSPKVPPSMQPPISKFYHGPVTGWNSAESSPSHNGSTFSLSSAHDFPPSLPPRGSPVLSAHQSPQISQGWHSQTPSSSSQFTSAPSRSNNHTLAASSCNTHIDPTWESGPLDNSSWGVNHRPKQPHIPYAAPKPPLPPRTHRSPDHPTSQRPAIQPSRVSATTIDVPLFLQPLAYDSVAAPALPDPPPALFQEGSDQLPSPPEPQRLPPLPPRKIPLETTEITGMNYKRPRYDPQQSYDERQEQMPPRLQRPCFDPENSYDESSRPPQMHQRDGQPTIPAPQFTSFNVQSALTSASCQREISSTPPEDHWESTQSIPDGKNGNHKASQHTPQASVSSVASMEHTAWDSNSRSRDSYGSHTEHQHSASSRHDGQSGSATDISSNAAGKSTPESHQTSNTSYKEQDNQSPLVEEGRRGDDSFYWHSGRSSSDPDEDHTPSSSPIPKPGEATADQRSSTTNSTIVQREHSNLPIRLASLSPAISASHGASALGFGGPSDWEYFGDYEAEEIDDEELYSRPRIRDSGNDLLESAELPADYPRANNATPLSGEAAGPTPGLSLAKPQSIPGKVSDHSNESGPPNSRALEEGDYDAGSLPRLIDGPSNDRPITDVPGVSADQSSQQRPDLDEVIRAWSEAPRVGKVDSESNGRKQSQDTSEKSLASKSGERVDNVGLPVENIVSVLSPPTSPPDKDPSAASSSVTAVQEAKQVDARDERSSPNHRSEGKVGDTNDFGSTTHVYSHSPNKSITGAAAVETPPGGPADDSAPSIDQSIPDIHTSERQPEASQTRPLTKTSGESTLSLQKEASELVLQNEQLPSTQVTSEATSIGAFRDPSLPDSLPQNSGIDSENSFDVMKNPTLRASSADMQKDRQQEQNVSSSAEDPQTRRAIEQLADTNDLEGTHEVSKASIPDRHMVDEVTTAGANEVEVATEGQPKKEDATRELSGPANSGAVSDGLHRSFGLSPSSGRADDPYADLDPWGKASLNRFAAMLREESRAETNKDKLNIFNVFTSRESRLRVVLYGSEDELIKPQQGSGQEHSATKPSEAAKVPEVAKHFEKLSAPGKSGFVKQAVHRANTMSLQRSLKALPALPASRDSVVVSPGNALAPMVVQDDPKLVTDQGSPTNGNAADEADYSPGGRPIIPRTSRQIKVGTDDASQKTAAISEVPDKVSHGHPLDPKSPTAIGFDDRTESSQQPAYVSPKHTEPRSEVNNYLANRKSVIRPYATLTQESLDSGSTFGKGPDVTSGSTINTAIVAPTSQYNSVSKSKNVDTTSSMTKPKTLENEAQPDLRQFVKSDFDPLLSILPGSEAVIHESARFNDLRDVMENIPDDFSFIHQSVVAWDAKTRKQREENDRQRHMRQIESEQRIDSLFDDHEIGYGDISELESEFRRLEAARKADEDRSEYQMFVSDVFTLVWTRLHYELDQLIPHYEQYSSLMNNTLAGRDMFEESSDGLALAPTMNLFLTLHQKLEIRHQKAFEAVLERDRRLKKTEISPWYTLSNIAKVKQLEKQFEDAEKKAIIEYCQQRNARANRLMDVLDQNTLRGVGTNQDYMEAIWKAVRRIASGRASSSMSGSNEPTAGMEEVEKAKTITALLATSSEQIVQTFHVADMLLNSADYEVSVARAKVADKMDLAALAKLKEERAKEDQKLMRDLEHRLALIREDTRRTNDEIIKLMLFLGITNGRADSAPTSQVLLGDAAHEARLQKASEEAKKRNALKESGY